MILNLNLHKKIALKINLLTYCTHIIIMHLEKSEGDFCQTIVIYIYNITTELIKFFWPDLNLVMICISKNTDFNLSKVFDM